MERSGIGQSSSCGNKNGFGFTPQSWIGAAITSGIFIFNRQKTPACPKGGGEMNGGQDLDCITDV
jgi:hypothetical protein